MAATEGDLNIELGAKLNKLERGLKKAEGEFKKYANTVNQESRKTASSMEGAFTSSLTKIGGAMAAAFSVQQLVQFGKEAVDLAAKAEGIEAAFNRLNRPDLLNNLREATRGTVTDVELMRQAVRAQNFQVPLEKLATFFEFATKRAAQTGESVDYLVNSIIDGIGRKSTLVLDNLGISAARLQEEVKKVGDFGLAAGNIIAEELGKAGDVALTSAQQIAAFNSELENTKKEIGEELIPLQLEWNKAVLGGVKGFKELGSFLSNFTWRPIALTAENFDKLEKAMGRTLSTQEKATIRANGFNEEQRALIETQATAESRFKQALVVMRQMTEGYVSLEEESNKRSDALDNEKKKVEELTAAEKERILNLRELQLLNQQATRISAGPITSPEIGRPTLDPDDMSDMLNEFLDRDLLRFENLDEASNLFFENLNTSLNRSMMLVNNFGGALNQAFTTGLENGLSFGDALKQMFEDLAKQMAAALLTALALRIALSFIPGVGQALTFGQLFQNQLGLGPLLNAVRSGGGGGLAGGMSGKMQISGVIRGSDIVLSTERSLSRRTRQTGTNGLIG